MRRLIDVQPDQEAVFLSERPDMLSAPPGVLSERPVAVSEVTPDLTTGWTSDHDFEQFFLEHYPRLVRTLLRLVGKSGQAEELAAEAFCRLHQHRSQRNSDGNPAGWLYRTAVNLGLDALRANSRRSRREERAQQERKNETAGNPLYELLAEEQRDRVRNVLAQLKPIQGQVLLMGSSGFTCKEIATVLGVKPDSLYVLISRAKAQFEKEYVNLYGRAE